MKTALSILKPEVKTRYLRNLLTEKVRYLEIPEHVGLEELKSDIRNGAVHMKELEPLLEKKNNARYIIITAQNEEQGFLAVSYLAACYQSGAEDTVIRHTGAAGSDVPKMPEISMDEDGDPVCDEEYWEEDAWRIPVICATDIIGATPPFGTNSPHFFNNFRIDQRNRNPDNLHHYWQDCTTMSVCITTGIGFRCPGINDIERLCDALDYFQENQRVYILHIQSDEAGDFDDYVWEDEEPDPDGETQLIRYDERMRNYLILNFSADDATVRLEKDKQKKYFKEVLRSHIEKNRMGVVKGFSYEKIINLILAMRSERTNDLIEKVFKYALKDRELAPGYQFKNEDFAFIDRFARTAEPKKPGAGRTARDRLMQELVGMEEVKQQVLDVVNMLKFNKLREAKGIRGSRYHNVHVMLGAPGTAKTTVAKLMGQIMVEEKLLSDNRFACINGAELKGMYVGHSAPRTKALFEHNEVIVIDEAYSLVDSNGEADCFSNEALAQLVIELEKHADDRLVIFAGYGGTDITEKNNRMKLFLDANPGIKSRINSTFFFGSYTAEEMLKIFCRIAQNEHYSVEAGAEDDLLNYFESRRTADNFGNGREARSLVEGSLLAMAKRLFAEKGTKKITAADMKLIRTADIRHAIGRAMAANRMQLGNRDNRIGF